MSRPLSKEKLKAKVVRSLRSQGFSIRAGKVQHRGELHKDAIRALHATAVSHKRSLAEPHLRRHEARLLARIANGTDVSVPHIAPRLRKVERNSEDELLFRYASLHWNIPVSSGYGRRLRFVVEDAANDKLIGIIGLSDPVIALKSRDNWIGWDETHREARLHNVMDAFVLGAVPPYNRLLCGKLLGLLAGCAEVAELFRTQYEGTISRIRGRRLDGKLALVTTTSALGRSSVYNRLRMPGGPAFTSLGFTRGSGEFHFTNGLYADLRAYADRYCDPSYRQDAWGHGFRNRREVIKKALPAIGLPSKWLYHGVAREVFAVELGLNARAFLRGEMAELEPLHASVQAVCEFFHDRWLQPRAKWDNTYRDFVRAEWQLWD